LAEPLRGSKMPQNLTPPGKNTLEATKPARKGNWEPSTAREHKRGRPRAGRAKNVITKMVGKKWGSTPTELLTARTDNKVVPYYAVGDS